MRFIAAALRDGEGCWSFGNAELSALGLVARERSLALLSTFFTEDVLWPRRKRQPRRRQRPGRRPPPSGRPRRRRRPQHARRRRPRRRPRQRKRRRQRRPPLARRSSFLPAASRFARPKDNNEKGPCGAGHAVLCFCAQRVASRLRAAMPLEISRGATPPQAALRPCARHAAFGARRDVARRLHRAVHNRPRGPILNLQSRIRDSSGGSLRSTPATGVLGACKHARYGRAHVTGTPRINREPARNSARPSCSTKPRRAVCRRSRRSPRIACRGRCRRRTCAASTRGGRRPV